MIKIKAKLSKDVTDYDIRMFREIEKFFGSEPGRYYLGQMGIDREFIIDKMKKERFNEDKIQNIDMLDGWDQAYTKLDRMKVDIERKLKASSITQKVPSYLEKLGGVTK